MNDAIEIWFRNKPDGQWMLYRTVLNPELAKVQIAYLRRRDPDREYEVRIPQDKSAQETLADIADRRSQG